MNRLSRSFAYAAAFALAVSLFSWVKLSFMCGTHRAFFSLSHCLSPLVGLFGGSIATAALLAIRSLLGLSFSTATTSAILACHFPTFCAGLYFSAARSTAARYAMLIIPAACMVLFCIHPVGSQAWAYSLFWLIPFATTFTSKRSLFATALGSTFTAHAVGSVLWLYLGLVPSPAVWMSLIPVVMCERLLFAGGMVVSTTLIGKTATVFTQMFNRMRAQQAATN